MGYSDYVPVQGIVANIERGYDCCTQLVSLETEQGTVDFIVGPATHIVDHWQLVEGMEILVFYDSSRPAMLIFPPRYVAELLVVLTGQEQIMLNYFNRRLVSRDRSLELRVGEETRIETINGQQFFCGLENRWLLVFYTMTTRSIPPQTTPERIIVLC